LGTLGLPRGPVASVQIVTAQLFWTGRKHPDCRLLFDGPTIRHIVRVEGNDDDLLRTWTHESLHARLPYDTDAADEAARHRGFEEGLVEGLARTVVRDAAGLHPLERSYAYYVAAYETLASALGIDPMLLWRRLWRFPTGRVRAVFASEVENALSAAAKPPLAAGQRRRLAAVADRLFASSRRDYPVSRDAMLAVWRTAIG
jgi:hypothetical protein